MSRKVKTRKDRRYEPRMISPVKAKPAAPETPGFASEPKAEVLFVPRANTQASSLQSTYEYVLSDLKQVAIITVLMAVLLAITYLILK